jgi:hypothetical protein
MAVAESRPPLISMIAFIGIFIGNDSQLEVIA